MSDVLYLKFGTLKGWDIESKEARLLISRYHETPGALGVMQREDTPEQTQILCELVDAIDGRIVNDWSGCEMSKDEAKQYLRGYRKDRKNRAG